jgi:hypothetical protein
VREIERERESWNMYSCLPERFQVYLASVGRRVKTKHSPEPNQGCPRLSEPAKKAKAGEAVVARRAALLPLPSWSSGRFARFRSHGCVTNAPKRRPSLLFTTSTDGATRAPRLYSVLSEHPCSPVENMSTASWMA